MTYQRDERKRSFEAGDVAMLGGGDESLKKTSLLGRIRRHPSAIRDVLTSASHHLPRVGLFKPKDIRDVTICIVERLPKDVRGSFGGRQLFQQYQDAQRQCLAAFRSQPRVGARIDWFRQPGSDVRLSARACRLHDVDRQSCRRRREECRGIANHGCDLPSASVPRRLAQCPRLRLRCPASGRRCRRDEDARS